MFCGLAGTVMRFVPGLALLADGPVNFDGDEQAYARPMRPVLEGLKQLGVKIEYHGEVGRLPLPLHRQPSFRLLRLGSVSIRPVPPSSSPACC